MIGSGEFLSTRILTDCIAAFRRKYPRIRYEIYSGNAVNIKDGIERGLLDMGLCIFIAHYASKMIRRKKEVAA